MASVQFAAPVTAEETVRTITIPTTISHSVGMNSVKHDHPYRYHHNVCRICQCQISSFQENLISPCQCKGTIGTVHSSCLEKWLSTSNRTQCEICQTSYDIVRTPLPFREWFRNPERPCDRRNVISDLVCFLILLPMSVMSGCRCLIYVVTNRKGINAHYELIGIVVILTAVFEIVFIVWIVTTIRYHCTVWKIWRLTHCQVQLRGNYQVVQIEPQTLKN